MSIEGQDHNVHIFSTAYIYELSWEHMRKRRQGRVIGPGTLRKVPHTFTCPEAIWRGVTDIH